MQDKFFLTVSGDTFIIGRVRKRYVLTLGFYGSKPELTQFVLISSHKVYITLQGNVSEHCALTSPRVSIFTSTLESRELKQMSLSPF